MAAVRRDAIEAAEGKNPAAIVIAPAQFAAPEGPA